MSLLFSLRPLLAVFLLAIPHAERILPLLPNSWTTKVSADVRTIATRMEILDNRELPISSEEYILEGEIGLAGDLRFLRCRLHEFRNIPLTADAERLPEYHFAGEFIAFNVGFRKQLVANMPLDPQHTEEFSAAIAETDDLYRVWDAVRDAKSSYYYITVRRRALSTLRELIGPEAYYRGELPPPVPLWRIPVWR